MDSLPTSEPSRAGGGLAPTSLLVGLLAACAGALAWAAVAFFTGYEVGYVAWALGGLVGLAMVRLGGGGVACASAAAVFTVAGIAGGKLLGTSFVVQKELREECAATFTPELHQEVVGDAADFALLAPDAGDEELRQFMVEHRYTSADSPEDVPHEELQAFLFSDAPELRELEAKGSSYEEWSAEHTAESLRAFEESFSIVQANLEELNPIDLLFVVLGVSTAFGIVRRGGAQGTEPALEQDTRKAA